MSTTPDPEQGMNIDQVAALWGVSRRTVRRQVTAGRLRFYKVGHLTRFRREDVLAARQQPTA
jgi:excisionase family DNA binding protein